MPSKSRTVLDRLEAEGVITPPFAKRLRQAFAADLVLSRPDSLMLVVALLQPDRADSRNAIKRDFALALEHDYYVAIGDPAATKRTADAAKIPRRTVSNAVRNSSVPDFLIPTIIKMMERPESWRNGSREESVAAIRQMIKGRPLNAVESRKPQLRKALARIRARIPAPRGVGNKKA
jgi:hypothetical protein